MNWKFGDYYQVKFGNYTEEERGVLQEEGMYFDAPAMFRFCLNFRIKDYLRKKECPTSFALPRPSCLEPLMPV